MSISSISETLVPVLIMLSATVVWLSPLYPRINPLLTRANQALSRIYGRKDQLEFETKSKKHVNVQAGRVRKGDKGFEIVKKGIEVGRPMLIEAQNEHGGIIEIGNAETRSDINYGKLFQEIIPGDITYVGYQDETFMPFIKDDWEIRRISDWTARMVERFTGMVVLSLVGIWSVVVIAI